MKNVTLMRQTSRWFLIPVVAFFLASCSSKTVDTDTAAKNLITAKEPALFATLKIKELLDKGGLSNYENVPLMFRPMIGDKLNMFVKSDETGLDFSKKAYLIMYPGKGEPEMVMLGNVSNEEKATSYLHDQLEVEPQENDGYKYIMTDGILAWNEKVIVMANYKGKKEDNLKRISALFDDMKNDEGTTKKAVEEALNNTSDIVMLVSQAKIGQLSQDQEYPKEYTELMKDCYNMATLSFEKGQITGKAKMMYTDKAKKEMNFMSKNGIPASFKSYMGLQSPWAAFSFSMNISAYYEKIMMFLPEQVRNQLEIQSGIDIATDPQIKAMISGIGGNFAVAVSSGKSKVIGANDKEVNYSFKPSLVGAADLQGELLKNLIDSILADKRKDGYYQIGEEGKALYIIFTPDNMAVFTNDQDVLNEVKTKGKLPEASSEYVNLLSKHPVAGYLDMPAMLAATQGYMNEATVKILSEISAVTFSSNMNEGELVIKFTHDDKNSLWILFNTIKKATSDMMKSKLM